MQLEICAGICALWFSDVLYLGTLRSDIEKQMDAQSFFIVRCFTDSLRQYTVFFCISIYSNTEHDLSMRLFNLTENRSCKTLIEARLLVKVGVRLLVARFHSVWLYSYAVSYVNGVISVYVHSQRWHCKQFLLVSFRK